MGKLLIEENADIAIIYITFLPDRIKEFGILMPHVKMP